MSASAPERPGRRFRIGASLAALALLVAFGMALGDAYALRLVALSGLVATTALGYQLVFGHAGAISLFQGAAFGLGAYVGALVARSLSSELLLAVPAAMLASGLAAALIAPALRRLGAHAFALATFAGAEILRLAAVNWESVTGGANGLAPIPAPTLVGLALPRGFALALIAWGLFGLVALAARWLMRGPFALGLALMREAPLAAEAAGIDASRRRLSLFVLSAAVGGAAGALHPFTLGTVSPEVMEIGVLITALVVTVIGGSRRPAGAALAALLIVHLPEWLRGFEEYYLILFGVLLLATILFAPEGLVEAVEGRLPLRRKASPLSAPAPEWDRPAADPSRPLLELAQIEKRFGGVTALAGMTLALAPGEILGIIGPNGSGKTTLLNIVGGQAHADAGGLRFLGRDIAALPPHRRARAGIARSFQTPPVVPGLNALDSVAAVAPGFGARALREARARALGLLDALGLGLRAEEPMTALSPGEARILDLARALMLRPRLLLLDEPAAGLTDAERARLGAALRRLAEHGVALIVVEHDVEFLAPLADRLACLEAGRLIALGSPEAVRGDPAVQAAYFGAAA
jgi:branched-chain amino acid transport system permease protein